MPENSKKDVLELLVADTLEKAAKFARFGDDAKELALTQAIELILLLNQTDSTRTSIEAIFQTFGEQTIAPLNIDEILEKVARIIQIDLTPEITSKFREKYTDLFSLQELKSVALQDIDVLNQPSLAKAQSKEKKLKTQQNETPQNEKARILTKTTTVENLSEVVHGVNLAGITITHDNHSCSTISIDGLATIHVIDIPKYNVRITTSVDLFTYILPLSIAENCMPDMTFDNEKMANDDRVVSVKKSGTHEFRIACAIQRIYSQKLYDGGIVIEGEKVTDVKSMPLEKRFGLSAKNIRNKLVRTTTVNPAIEAKGKRSMDLYKYSDVLEAIEELLSLESGESLKAMQVYKCEPSQAVIEVEVNGKKTKALNTLALVKKLGYELPAPLVKIIRKELKERTYVPNVRIDTGTQPYLKVCPLEESIAVLVKSFGVNPLDAETVKIGDDTWTITKNGETYFPLDGYLLAHTRTIDQKRYVLKKVNEEFSPHPSLLIHKVIRTAGGEKIRRGNAYVALPKMIKLLKEKGVDTTDLEKELK